jgi:orc1/cdc6 family replication initiation protein
MIQDAHTLQEKFIPNKVKHRKQEMNVLVRALDPILRGESTETTLLFGPTGAGKTCLAQFIIDCLAENTAINYQYVDCWQDYTRFRALYRIMNGIGATTRAHRGAATTDSLLHSLEDYDGPSVVVILDEVDQLQDESLLADLYRTPKVSMLLIANREERFMARLDDRLISRLRASVRVRFKKYDLKDLISILEDRVKWGLDAGAVGRDQLARIADAAAGDARVAISILRNAAWRAEGDDARTITTEMIRDVIPNAKKDVRQKHIDQLRPHQRALYEIVCDADGIAPADLYERYRERVDEPRSNRTVRNYLSKLAHYNLVVKDGTGRGRTYHSSYNNSREYISVRYD